MVALHNFSDACVFSLWPYTHVALPALDLLGSYTLVVSPVFDSVWFCTHVASPLITNNTIDPPTVDLDTVSRERLK